MRRRIWILLYWIDRSLDLVEGRFEEVWLRGDTDFSLTEHLDRWDKRCKFVLGFDARPNLVALAQGIVGRAVGGVGAEAEV